MKNGKTETFDIAILDIMGVNGYELLALARQHQVISVMLTARALSPEDVKKSIGPTIKSVLKKSKIPVIVMPFVEGEEPLLPMTPGWRKQ
ncbi:MAG: hypothetical protein Q8N95_05610 [Desulfobacterales bacterium]|nr:hypothetical protein [Desulfobacterales bacterium]